MATLALLVLAGCSDRSNWLGDWKGRRDLVVPLGADPSVGESLATVKLTIQPSGHFVLTEESMDKEGSAVLGDKEATLYVEKMLGRTITSLGPEAVSQGGERKLRMNSDGSVTFVRAGLDDLVLKHVQKSAP